MSQSKGRSERPLRARRNEFIINIPPELTRLLELEGGQYVAIHNPDQGPLELYNDIKQAPAYAHHRKIRHTDECTVNMPVDVVTSRELETGQKLDWGEPENGVVELTPQEAR